jgi:hypothetical protein
MRKTTLTEPQKMTILGHYTSTTRLDHYELPDDLEERYKLLLKGGVSREPHG